MQRLKALTSSTIPCAIALAALTALAAGPVIAQTQAEDVSRQPVDIVETKNLNIVLTELQRIRADQSDGRLLVIFDIDNTLLTMPQALGGDAWYNYHADLVKKGEDPDFATMDELFEAQEVLFGIGSMISTQTDIQALFDQIEADDTDIFLLSARGPTLYDATRKQLSRNGISLNPPTSCSFLICDLDGEFSGRDVSQLLARMELLEPGARARPIVMRDGVMLVAGQDKGKMLQLLLAALGVNRYEHVVFIDDNARNTAAVAASDLPMGLSVFHYTRFEEAVSARQLAHSHAQWQSIRNVVCASVTSRICSSGFQDSAKGHAE